MAMTLPGELVWVLDMLDYEWPPLDEDELRRAASITRTFREDLIGTMEAASSRINDDVPAAFKAGAAKSYTSAWNETREQHMQQLVDLLEPAATGIDVMADAVVALKVKVIAELVITAAQIAAAIATAALTFGLSAAANAAIIAARKAALKIATNIALEALLGQILSMVIEPLTEGAVAFITAIADAPLVEGAMGEAKEFQADFAALEQAAGDIETTGSEQEKLGGQYIQQIASLQIIQG
jgi:uncharacterized protein YukE